MSHAQLHEWIAPPHTALCIIDYQVDFASPDGLLGKAGIPMEPVLKVKPGIEKLYATRGAFIGIHLGTIGLRQRKPGIEKV